MVYRLIATDIDGTLLDDQHAVTPRVYAVVRELERRKIPLILVTARPSRTIFWLHQQLDLASPFIAYNGALIYHPATKETLLHQPISLPVAKRLLACVRTVAQDIPVGLEMSDGWYLDAIRPDLQTQIDAGLVEVLPTVCAAEMVLDRASNGVNKLYFVAPEAIRGEVEALCRQDALHTELTFTSSGKEFVEISAANVDKGTAVAALAKLLGIPLEQTIALGDGENDIAMLRTAGLGIAMGNASETVRSAANRVTGLHSQDGWAEAIERFILSPS